MDTQDTYLFDVKIKNLELIDEDADAQNSIKVEFDCGELAQPIAERMLNTTEFISSQPFEIKTEANQFYDKVLANFFKLKVFSNQDGQQDLLGEAIGDWPASAVNAFLENEEMEPFQHSLRLTRDGDFVGDVIVDITIRKKCPEVIKSRPLGILANKKGQLSFFDEIKKTLEPNDIFFVVGEAQKPNAENETLQGCRGEKRCRTPLDNARYRLVQGRLVKDFSVLPNCEDDECCANKNVLDEFAYIFDKLPNDNQDKLTLPDEKKRNTRKSRRPSKPCAHRLSDENSIESCGALFGKSPRASNEKSNMSSNTLIHMPDCPTRNMHNEDKSSFSFSDTESTSRCSSSRESSSSESKSSSSLLHVSESVENITKLVNKVVERAQKCEKRQDEVPRTCSAPSLRKSDIEIQPRACPICCEDMSWVQLHSPCPKCGFTSKVPLPIEEMAYNENQTARDILDKWKADVAKYRKRKDISPLGVCLCTGNTECINCQLRRVGQPDADKLTRLSAKFGDVNKGLGEIVERENVKNELRRKTMVSKIVSEVLGEPEHRPTLDVEKMLLRKDSEPDVAKALRWVKNQLDRKDKALDSSGDLSKHSRTSVLGKLHQIAERPLDDDSWPLTKEEEKAQNKHEKALRDQEKKFKEECKEKHKYPPRTFGHYDCTYEIPRVPKNMGWWWNLNIEKERRGWRPGAICRKTHAIMSYFTRKKEEERAREAERIRQLEKEACEKAKRIAECDGLPRLNIIRENGNYKIVLHPRRDPTLDPSQLPEDMKPIEFVITKAEHSLKRRQIRECLAFSKHLKDECGNLIPSKENTIQYEAAIQNIKDLLQEHNLRDILNSESEGESSIDIEFGGPMLGGQQLLKKKVSKHTIQVQTGPDLGQKVKIPSRSGMFYIDPFTGQCSGPHDKKPQIPKHILDEMEGRSKRKPKRPSLIPKSADSMKLEKGSSTVKRPGKKPGKVPATKPKPGKDGKPGNARKPGKEAKTGKGGKPGKGEKPSKEKSKGKEKNKKGEKSGKKDKGNSGKQQERKPEVPSTSMEDSKKPPKRSPKSKQKKPDHAPVEEVPTSQDTGPSQPNDRPSRPPLPRQRGSKDPHRRQPQKPDQPSSRPPLPPLPRRRSLTLPMTPKPFQYDPKKYLKRRLPRCKIVEKCNLSPLTEVDFLANDPGDDCNIRPCDSTRFRVACFNQLITVPSPRVISSPHSFA